MLFQITENLCERYTALTPFLIRKERNGEVFLLVNRINDLPKKMTDEKGNEIKVGEGEEVRKLKNGDILIRTEAKNDNWF